MYTLNTLHALQILAKLSEQIYTYHSELTKLMQAASTFEIRPAKARKEYKRIIEAAFIDCKREIAIANKYFNHSGLTPSKVENVNIYRFDNFGYIIRFFEL